MSDLHDLLRIAHIGKGEVRELAEEMVARHFVNVDWKEESSLVGPLQDVYDSLPDDDLDGISINAIKSVLEATSEYIRSLRLKRK